MRRGIAELDGQGEVTGGVVVMRSGKNARTTIEAVKAKLTSLKGSLPPGVEVVPTYDRSLLIDRAVDNLRMEAARGVLGRGARVRGVPVPPALGASWRWSPCRSACWRVHRHAHGKASAPTSSLGGIAIALGAMVDGAIVLIENAHKHLETFETNTGEQPTPLGAMGAGHRGVHRSWAGAVLLAAGHHAVVRSGVHAGSAGGQAVLAAGLHKDLRNGGRCRAVGDAGPCSHGLPGARAHTARGLEPPEPVPDRHLPARLERCCGFPRRRSQWLPCSLC
jgi:hypothetical protein